MRILRVVEGPAAGEVFALAGRTIIGRGGDSDIQIIDRGISRHHMCLAETDNGQMLLMDLSSSNGTFVFNERVDQRLLNPGDAIRIGETVLVFEEHDQLESEEDMDLKLLSGPAIEATALRTGPEVLAGSLYAGTMPVHRSVSCGNALHDVAADQGWKHCPACGEQVN